MSLKDKLFVSSQYLAPQHAISRMAGKLAESRQPLIRQRFIEWFIQRYGVNMQEAAKENASDYETFNDFFTRALKPGMRNTTVAEGTFISPVDGCISETGAIDGDRLLQAKGQTYSLTDLLGGDPAAATPFENGHFATIYLAPKDYHRIHMPLAGKLTRMVYVPGQLFSVNPVTAQNVSRLFARNERVVCFFETEAGPMAMVLVGAMIVASVSTVWAGRVAPNRGGIQTTDYPAGQVSLEGGAEMGRFHLGSTVVLAFGNNKTEWDPSLKAGQVVRLGEQFGTVAR